MWISDESKETVEPGFVPVSEQSQATDIRSLSLPYQAPHVKQQHMFLRQWPCLPDCPLNATIAIVDGRSGHSRQAVLSQRHRLRTVTTCLLESRAMDASNSLNVARASCRRRWFSDRKSLSNPPHFVPAANSMMSFRSRAG